MDEKKKNQLVLVTGASEGIGKATTELLIQKGHRVIGVARSKDKLEALKENLGENFFSAPTDVTIPEEVDKLKSIIQEKFHQIPDEVINCAGAGRWLFVHETTPEEADFMMKMPFFGSYLVSRLYLSDFLQRDKGHIINVSTPVSLFPWPGATLYASSRFALTGFTRALKADLDGTQVHVSLILPGEVSSTYFSNNPGTHERLPKIAKLFPVLTTEQVARSIVKVLEKNKSMEVIIPWQIKLTNFFGRFFPGLVQWLITKSGHRYITSQHGQKK